MKRQQAPDQAAQDDPDQQHEQKRHEVVAERG